jgi:hypothetical protein
MKRECSLPAEIYSITEYSITEYKRKCEENQAGGRVGAEVERIVVWWKIGLLCWLVVHLEPVD